MSEELQTGVQEDVQEDVQQRVNTEHGFKLGEVLIEVVPIKPRGSVKVTLTSETTLVDILLGKSGQMRVYHRRVPASHVPRAPKNIAWTPEKYEEILALSDGGMSKKELAEKYSLTTLRIYQVLAKARKIRYEQEQIDSAASGTESINELVVNV